MNNEGWVKITSIQDFHKMKAKSYLIEFPLNREPEEAIDLSNKADYRTYIIERIQGLGKVLELNPDGTINNASDGLYNFSSSFLHKDFDKMIKENKWWYLPK